MNIRRLLPILLIVALLLAGCSGFERLNASPTALPAAPPTNAPPVAEVTLVPETLVPTATAPPTKEPEPPTAPDPEADNLQTRGVYLDGLQVTVLESFPVEVRAEVSGSLADGCTTLRGTKAEREGNVFTIQFDVLRDPALACTEALVPFKETVPLDVEQLAAGTYTVAAGEEEALFTLVADNVAPPDPDLSGASLVPATDMARPGDTILVSGSGFPAGATVELGLGMLNGEYELVESAVTAPGGTFGTSLTIPANASPGQIWVFVAAIDTETVLSDGVTVIPGPATVTAVPPEARVNVAVNGRFTRTYIYLIALEDGGASGPEIGCGDSAISVIAEIEPTVAPMGAAYHYLLALEDEYYGESGLYNALHRSSITLQGINIVNRQATVRLNGELILGGACDAPRVEAQLSETALQYTTVESVRIFVNGTPLEELLSGQ